MKKILALAVLLAIPVLARSQYMIQQVKVVSCTVVLQVDVVKGTVTVVSTGLPVNVMNVTTSVVFIMNQPTCTISGLVDTYVMNQPTCTVVVVNIPTTTISGLVYTYVMNLPTCTISGLVDTYVMNQPTCTVIVVNIPTTTISGLVNTYVMNLPTCTISGLVDTYVMNRPTCTVIVVNIPTTTISGLVNTYVMNLPTCTISGLVDTYVMNRPTCTVTGSTVGVVDTNYSVSVSTYLAFTATASGSRAVTFEVDAFSAVMRDADGDGTININGGENIPIHNVNGYSMPIRQKRFVNPTFNYVVNSGTMVVTIEGYVP